MTTDLFCAKYLVIGDTHLYPGFKYSQDLLRLLWWADWERYRVFFAGDILEGYRKKNSLAIMDKGTVHEAELSVRIRMAMLENRMVRGNHDNELPEIGKLPDILYGPDSNTVLFHGHRFDMWYRNEEWEEFSDNIGKAAQWLEDIGLSGAGKAARNFRDTDWDLRAMNYAQCRLAGEGLALGAHTHIPKITKHGDVTLAVGGTFKYGPPYHIIKVENSTPQIATWTGKQFA